MSDLSELYDRFSALYTGAITDVLDRRGYLRQTLPPVDPPAPMRHARRRAGVSRKKAAQPQASTTSSRSA